MPTVNNLRVGGTTAINNRFTGKAGLVKNTIDCATTALGAGDSAQLIDIPAGHYVKSVMVKITTADTGSSTRTFSVGDGDSASLYLSGANAKSATYLLGDGSTGSVATGAKLSKAVDEAGSASYTIAITVPIGKLYTSAGILSLTAVEALSNFKATVVAEVLKVG